MTEESELWSDCTVCLHSSRVPAGPGGLSAQRSAQRLQPDPLGGLMWSLQAPTSPLLLLLPDSGPSFCRAAPESPMVGRRTPLPRSGSFSLQPAPGGGVRPGCEENHERSRKGVSSGSAPSSDLGPPSLLPDASCSSPHFPPTTPITSFPIVLLWIRVIRGGL